MLVNPGDAPLGLEVLAPCIMESILAAGERNIDHYDAMNPQAIHNRALPPLLAMAIKRDQQYASAGHAWRSRRR